MAGSRSASLRREPDLPGKAGFAKRAWGFVKRAPGANMLWIGCATACGIMIVTGGFGTIAMPLVQRIPFWLLLMGWNGLKWQLWFVATVRTHRDWFRAAMLGAVLLSLSLPLEIWLCARAVGTPARFPDPFGTWGRALAIGVVIFAAIVMIMHARGNSLFAKQRRKPTTTANGLLGRARVAPEALAAIEAEDHYCRVRRRDGSSELIHYRFGDAIGELEEIDGLQVHRGAWVAADAVTGAAREGRRWLLILADGSRIAVSATHVAAARDRGWLRL